MVYFKQTMPLNFFKGCFPQILIGPFLNILTHLISKVHQMGESIKNLLVLSSTEHCRRVQTES